jgi:hypothetical protein
LTPTLPSQLFWTASGKSPPPCFSQEQQHYTREQAEIELLARDLGFPRSENCPFLADPFKHDKDDYGSSIVQEGGHQKWLNMAPS